MKHQFLFALLSMTALSLQAALPDGAQVIEAESLKPEGAW